MTNADALLKVGDDDLIHRTLKENGATFEPTPDGFVIHCGAMDYWFFDGKYDGWGLRMNDIIKATEGPNQPGKE